MYTRSKESLKFASILLLAGLIFVVRFSTITSGQPAGQVPQPPLPVLLIHGYFSNASVWDEWEKLLRNDSIKAIPITFTLDDACGSAEEHALELNRIVESVLSSTGEEKVNIVAHSKGGLDARGYLESNLSKDDIANLIMIGTPNAGSPLGNVNNICRPAIYDLRPGSPATNVDLNNNTKYHTIAGNWIPSLTSPDTNCSPNDITWLEFQQYGSSKLQSPNDGIVSLSSVQSMEGSNNLGTTNNCHTDLLGSEEYELAREVLLLK